jgi:general stress protein YciG
MTETRKPMGLAALSPERRREIASMGGKAATIRYFRANPEAAKEAGRKGGLAKKGKRHGLTHDNVHPMLEVA